MNEIMLDDLRKMNDREGLILQGCGGDLQEWIEGINKMFTQEGILLDGSRFETALPFQMGDRTNLLLPFDSVKLDMGKLAMWRLLTHDLFGGIWLSDYVPNRLGGFQREQAPQKPCCSFIGQDGNLFNLLGVAARTLRKSGMTAEAEEMIDRVTGGDCHSYVEALTIISEYVALELPNAMEPKKCRKKEKNVHER